MSSGSGHRADTQPRVDEPVPAQTQDALEQLILDRIGDDEISGSPATAQFLTTVLSQLRAKDAMLRSSEAQLRDFVENAAVGIHRVGPDGTILWANRAELALLGYDEDEYIGRPIGSFHADQPVIDDILARLNRGEEIRDYEARLRAKDGSLKHVLISSNVYAPDGQFVHTRCFTRDITERRRNEEAVLRSEQQLRLITDALPALISFVDPQQRYQFVSASYERWFGRSKTQLVGKHLAEVLGPGAYDAVRPHVERALSGTTSIYETELPHADGGTRIVEATYIPQRSSDGLIAGFVALIVDISERKRFDRFKTAIAARAERLSKVTAAIADAVNATEVFEAVVDRAAEAVGASTAALWLVDEPSRTARLARSFGYAEESVRHLEALPLDSERTTPAVDAIRRGTPILIPSQKVLLEQYPHLSSVATFGRSYEVSCWPLIAQGRVLGTLAFTVDEEGESTDEEREFLGLVAKYSTQAIERLRLLVAERRSRNEADDAATRLRILNDASRAFADSKLDLEARLRSVASELATALDSCINIGLLETDGLLHLTAVQHPDPEAQELLQGLSQGSPLRVGEGMTGSIAASGESVFLPTLDPTLTASRAAVPYAGFLRRFPAYALIGVALRVQGRVIGTVTATRCRAGETYTQDDLRLLDDLATRAATAIENSRLYQETLDARTRAEQLYRFAQVVVGADRLEIVFDAAIGAVAAALGAERSAILTFDNERVMRFRAWRNLSDGYRSAVDGHSPWPADATSPEPVIVSNAKVDPAMAAYRPFFEREGIAALAFIPVVNGGRLLGKLMVYHDHPHAFSVQEVETARAIANHLGSVIVRFGVVAKLEDTIRNNELFAGALAHDLRNPLGAIMNAAQLALLRREGEAATTERNTKPLGRIISSGQRMTVMIDQLLDFTRARAGGGIAIHPRDVDLASLCTQVVNELELARPEWRIQCEIVGDQTGTWDPERLLQVLSNLLTNAGQHGTAGTPIRMTSDGTVPAHVTVDVHNLGAIPEPLQLSIFDPFRSTRHSRAQSSGLGLGLFIVRELVRAHEGTVDVSSSDADGTTFSVRLPRHATRAPTTAQQPPRD